MYIRSQDQAVWEEAEKVLLPGETLSSVLTRPLRKFVEERKTQSSRMERIELDIDEETGIERGIGILKSLSSDFPLGVRPLKQAFVGRWLIKNFELNKGFYPHPMWSIALTGKGKIAVFRQTVKSAGVAPKGGDPIEVFENLEEALDKGNIPRDVLAAANERLDNPLVEELDI